ncbi:MAG: tryptophan synthase subunit alpha [Hyphomonadaceae bacterium]|nr:MAG: tryptophan synthase alpha chain [Caulobacteraceae bacterium]MBT9447614.1 tryptophan synthase subunit alpha [Hyphomonadaceae bacterium]TPW04607.1 MAG: tryptophan synthase alpha chain [Alphaproteobacteria bacterium]
MTSRITSRFAALKAEGRAGLIAYVMAFDPDGDTSLEIIKALPAAGADLIEIGFPFSDPMAEGPSIQKASERALKASGSLKGVLDLVARFRETDKDTPVILMGYCNPVEQMGAAAFAERAKNAGADGAIIVDLPPEEDIDVRTALGGQGLSLIRLAAPTTDDARLPVVLEGVTGFLYYVSVTGVTGAKAIGVDAAQAAVERLKRSTDLPIAVGFGVRDAASASAIARVADAVVVGSAFVDVIAKAATDGAPVAAAVAAKVQELARAVRTAREQDKTA